jgi:hypothetical protein
MYLTKIGETTRPVQLDFAFSALEEAISTAARAISHITLHAF